ncbi:MAG: class A beta-lactamase-related serine hydrolase [Actinomycetota bacterium]|nr:class A beta-lactamase-related serine hydrolase [Actinomycetota bacterium]
MTRRLEYLLPLFAAVVLAAVGCTNSAESSSVSSSESSATPELSPTRVAEVDFQAGIDEATAFASSQGIEVSIAVIDRELDDEAVNGAAADTPVFGASLVKLFLADNLLQRQRAGEFGLSAEDRSLLEAMLVASDDAAADSLYSRFGGEAMVTEVAQRYRLPSVAPTTEAGLWELTTMSARDVARYYDRFLSSMPSADRDYVVGLLRGSTMIAQDGFDQFFGLPTALGGLTVAIKQAWMCCPRDTSYLHTTGILGSDNRYTVAILSGDPGVLDSAFSTDVLSQITSLVFPPMSIVD